MNNIHVVKAKIEYLTLAYKHKPIKVTVRKETFVAVFLDGAHQQGFLNDVFKVEHEKYRKVNPRSINSLAEALDKVMK